MKNSNIPKLAWLSALLGLVLGVGGYFVSNSYLSGFTGNLATTFIGLSAGLFVVNIYLDREARKLAVMSFLKLIAPSIQNHHNALLNEAWNNFGKPQWGELMKRYADNHGDPQALTPEERQKIYDMVKVGKNRYDVRFTQLESELKELALLLGWSFDADVLSLSFNCRFAIVKFRALTLDDSAQAKLEACEHFLDAEFASSAIFQRLVEIVGIDKKAVYGGHH